MANHDRDLLTGGMAVRPGAVIARVIGPIDGFRLRGPLRDRMTAAIEGERFADRACFNPYAPRRRASGAHDHSAPLWSLLMFEAFVRLDGVAGATSRRQSA